MPRSFARSTGKRYALSYKISTNNRQSSIGFSEKFLTAKKQQECLIEQQKKITKKDDTKIKKRITRIIKFPEFDSGAESAEDLCSETKDNHTSINSDDTILKDHTDDIESKYSCSDCGKTYSTQSNLSRHKQIHRSLNDKKAKTCPDCGKVYVSIPAFSMHVRTHNQNCLCPICGSSFSRPWLLQGHLRTHTGERPYKCQICEKDFADRSNLRAHKQTHSQVKPYQCELCSKRFALKSYLSKHKSTVCTKRI